MGMRSGARYWGAVGLTAAILAGCGGGDSTVSGGGSSSSGTQGNVAMGFPLVGATVTAHCSPGTLTSGLTDATGAWSVDTSGVTFPCIVEATGGTVNGAPNTRTLHSIMLSSGRVNITTLTDEVVRNLAGGDPATYFANFGAANASGVNTQTVQQAQQAVFTWLQNNGITIPATVTDLIGGELVPANGSQAGNDYDHLLDNVVALVGAGGSGSGGGSGGTPSCNTSHYQAGAVRQATSTELAGYARTYTGNTGTFSMSGFTSNGGNAVFVLNAAGALTYNNAAQTVTSLCIDNTLPMIYVEFGSAAAVDFFSSGEFTGNLSDGTGVYGAASGGGGGGSGGSGSVSTATGDLTTTMRSRTLPSGMIAVNGANITPVISDGSKIYAYAWNFVTHSNYYYNLTTSTDGVNWSPVQRVTTLSNSYEITAKNGVLVAVGCEAGPNSTQTFTVKRSTDGITWTTQTNPGVGSSYCLPSDTSIDTIGSTFVAVHKETCNTLISNDAGVTWTASSIPLNSNALYGGVGGQYKCGQRIKRNGLLVMQHGIEATRPPGSAWISKLAYSTTNDGVNWTLRTITLDPAPQQISTMSMVGNEVRVYQGTSVWTTTDLINWTSVPTTLPFVYTDYWAIGFGYSNGGSSSAIQVGGNSYACRTTNSGAPNYTSLYALKSSTDGIHFNNAPLFASGGAYASGTFTCGNPVYLDAANRLVMFLRDPANPYTPVVISND